LGRTAIPYLKIDPNVTAVVSSGYSDDAAIATYLSQGFKVSLKKPYSVEFFQAVLNQMLTRE
jgi:two-component system cell cycle sensor histidine kinase/response regulator CckA